MSKHQVVGCFVLTQAQARALQWFLAHNGDGARQPGSTVLAGGEVGPHQPQTWARLERMGLVESYRVPCCGRRLRLTEVGRDVAERIPAHG